MPTHVTYEGYSKWKKWDSRAWGIFSAKKAREYRLLVGTDVRGLCLFELGFGNGAFLSWAKSSGANVFGAETEPLMLSTARSKGFHISQNFSEEYRHLTFDVIVAFDVLEHLTVKEISEFFRFSADTLHPNGRIVVKVPNSACPFALGMQDGDLTHVTRLTVTSLSQILSEHPLEVVKVRPHLAPLPGGFAGIRSLLQRALRKAYARLAEFMWDLSEDNFYQCLVIEIQKDSSVLR